MELRVCLHISGRKVNLCTIRILHESSTFAGHNGSQHKREPGLSRSPLTEKRLPIRIFFPFSGQSGANPDSNWILWKPRRVLSGVGLGLWIELG